MAHDFPLWRFPPLAEVFIDRQASESPLAVEVIRNLSRLPAYSQTKISLVEDYHKIWPDYQQHPFEKKDTLLLYNHGGRFLQACPGSGGVLCCHYFVINLGVNCSYDCSYCFLQSYLHNSLLTIFANTGDMLKEIGEKISHNEGFHWRIGTGEFTDSLALDHLTGLGKILVNFFAAQKNATLELKTKSASIENLLDLDHNRHTVVSWSLNPQTLVDSIERGTAPLLERLKAAAAVAAAGYYTAFHFDPLVWYENWEEDYKKVIDLLFEHVNPASIRWISLGTFRYSPDFRDLLQKREPDEFLTRAEMFPGEDGKFRYFSLQRAEMYRKMQSWLLQKDKSLFIYLCMETKDSWQRVSGLRPTGPLTLDRGFESRRQMLLDK